MSSADDWFTATARTELARVRSDARQLIERAEQFGSRACRKHPIATVAIAALAGAGVVGALSAGGRDRKRRRRRGLIGSSLAGALRAVAAHIVSASIAPTPTPTRDEARVSTPSAEKSLRT